MTNQRRRQRIVIGADHAGLRLKEALRDYLRGRGEDVVDIGTHGEAPVDYPDYAHQVADRVATAKADRGILVCGSAQGMAMAANRHPGVRAALLRDASEARLSREHNDANVACLGGRTTSVEQATAIIDTWLQTEFQGGRHERRVRKIEHRGPSS